MSTQLIVHKSGPLLQLILCGCAHMNELKIARKAHMKGVQMLESRVDILNQNIARNDKQN